MIWYIFRHFSTPEKPHIEGIENFKGRKIHSHDYREPSPYRDSRITILGAGPSGMDILMEVSALAKEVRRMEIGSIFVRDIGFWMHKWLYFLLIEKYHITVYCCLVLTLQSMSFFLSFGSLIPGTSLSQPSSSLPFWTSSKYQTSSGYSESCRKWLSFSRW